MGYDPESSANVGDISNDFIYFRAKSNISGFGSDLEKVYSVMEVYNSAIPVINNLYTNEEAVMKENNQKVNNSQNQLSKTSTGFSVPNEVIWNQQSLNPNGSTVIPTFVNY